MEWSGVECSLRGKAAPIQTTDSRDAAPTTHHHTPPFIHPPLSFTLISSLSLSGHPSIHLLLNCFPSSLSLSFPLTSPIHPSLSPCPPLQYVLGGQRLLRSADPPPLKLLQHPDTQSNLHYSIVRGPWSGLVWSGLVWSALLCTALLQEAYGSLFSNLGHPHSIKLNFV